MLLLAGWLYELQGMSVVSSQVQHRDKCLFDFSP